MDPWIFCLYRFLDPFETTVDINTTIHHSALSAFDDKNVYSMCEIDLITPMIETVSL